MLKPKPIKHDWNWGHGWPHCTILDFNVS